MLIDFLWINRFFACQQLFCVSTAFLRVKSLTAWLLIACLRVHLRVYLRAYLRACQELAC
jgi:hypothetical protein